MANRGDGDFFDGVVKMKDYYDKTQEVNCDSDSDDGVDLEALRA